MFADLFGVELQRMQKNVKEKKGSKGYGKEFLIGVIVAVLGTILTLTIIEPIIVPRIIKWIDNTFPGLIVDTANTSHETSNGSDNTEKVPNEDPGDVAEDLNSTDDALESTADVSGIAPDDATPNAGISSTERPNQEAPEGDPVEPDKPPAPSPEEIMISGTISGVKPGPPLLCTIEGTQYEFADEVVSHSLGIVNEETLSSLLDKNCTLYLDEYGYVIGIETNGVAQGDSQFNDE